MTIGNWTTIKLTEIEPHITVLALNRPEQRNALNAQMAQELEACLLVLKVRQDLRVLILTGEGTAFGAGADLKERAKLTPEQTQEARVTFLRCLEMIEALRVPVIAMINGPAIAGAFECALACDIRVASDQAFFSLPEVSTLGAFPGAGGPVRLSRLVGRGRANLVVLTGRKFSAEEAFTLGFVEVVVTHSSLWDETSKLARQIAANNAAGISAAKQLIHQSRDLDLQSAMELSRILREPMDCNATVKPTAPE
ncbi:enoyl-CoA hydratase/isomerase family protein [Pseudomonas sp. YuFO20]|uniref:enoyl-CoA hydratase/isomerase family protein n=1 Tax=Pseudomonas sp. YuFO20 TaxID=3095362 RepID=UPI002B252500|nr:enoyl-CoA hydratase/isomerase family protein [Pseudomonas sp. YuFO20]MEB2519030.1 enoyl-CoA hydratase/isomerase family protein [Pseudomonas sp. YuFO20]